MGQEARDSSWPEGRLTSLLLVLGPALAYLVAGRLALLLAIPPGYATPIWPAAGVAWLVVLVWGYRTLPGVWLGSFLVNVSTGFDAGDTSAALASLVLPAAIGIGAVLHAGLAALAARRLVGYPNPLERDAAIVLFLAIGGPLGCVVSATWGTACLLLSGAISGPEWAFSWLTWWAGDGLGVLLVVPPALAWLGAPVESWRPRRALLSAPLGLLMAASVALYVLLSGQQQERIEQQIAVRAELAARLVSDAIQQPIELLRGLQAHIETGGEPELGGFRAFLGDALARHPTIQAIEWAPRLRAEERSRFEAAARRRGLSDFEVRERGPDALIRRAELRPEYAPVLFTEPLVGNESALGFDLASEPTRRAALERARDTGEPAVTGRLRLVQDEGSEYGFLVAMAVYRGGGPQTVDERRERLRGHVVGVFRATDLLERAVGPNDFEGLGYRLEVSGSGDAGPLAEIPGLGARLGAGRSFSSRARVDVAGQPFALEVVPTTTYLGARRDLQAWAVLVGTLLFAGLFSVFLLSVTGREGEVRRLVDERTLELETTRLELERSNRDLDHFASAASHDLQAPLRTILTHVDLLREQLPVEGAAAPSLEAVERGARRLLALVRGVLAYSRIGGAGPGDATIDSNAVLEEVVERLRADSEAAGASLLVEPLPLLRGDPTRLGQVLQNLLSNAIKYRGERPPEVQLSVERDAPGLATIHVRDNGIGFRQKHAERVFDVFSRLHPSQTFEGTGIGLALVRRIVEQAGGRVWAESIPGSGSTFSFTWPLAAEPLTEKPEPGEPDPGEPPTRER